MKKGNNKSKLKKREVRSRNFMPIIVIILGLVFGGLLIGVGIYNSVNSDYDAMKTKSEEQLKQEVSDKSKEVEDIRKKRNEEYEISALSEDYEKYSRELTKAEGDLYDLEAELYNVQNGFYKSLEQEKFVSSVPLIAIGAAVIIFAFGLALRFSTAKKKNVILTVSEEK